MNSHEQQRIGRTIGDSAERWAAPVSAPPGAPNVVMIVLDDVGFAQLGCFGGSIRTPGMDRLAREGLRYTNFHTTAVCSPTRASLLTGRNCHAVGFGHVTERLAGFPGYTMQLPDSAATIAEILRGNGYSTTAVGKWHLTPSYETGPQGPFDRWPLGRGFEHFYGFLGGSTDQFRPELYQGNSPVPPPAGPEDGYHLSADLVDQAIGRIRDLRGLAPHRPFLTYLAFGCGHAPHQAPREWIEQYRGAFDHGWDAERERVLARQIESGVMPEGARLGPSNPGVRPWEDLSDDERRLATRMMEVYAGFVSYTDAQIGRLLDYLDEIGEADNTVVLLCSDNGASAEGGPDGSVDEGLYLNDQPQVAADALPHIDSLGGPALYNHYPWGWAQAGNTPFRWYKQFTHAGGITNGLLMRWPGGRVPAGAIRRQYHHVIDVMPTLLDVIGVQPPAQVRGVTQQPIDGISMAYSFRSADAPGRRHTQHYEMWGNRGLWHDGWMAVCRLHPDAAGASPPAPHTVPFDELPWELYHHDSDPSECVDLASSEQRRLRELIELWWAAAGRYQVLPVDNRPRSEHWPAHPPLPVGADPECTVFLGPGGPYERGVAPKLAGRSFRLDADVTVPDAATGVLYTVGGLHGGYTWYLRDGVMLLEAASSSVRTRTVTATRPLPAGRYALVLQVASRPDLTGSVTFAVDGETCGGGELDRLLKRVPIGCGRTYLGRAAVGTVSGDVPPPAILTGTIHRLTATTGDEAVRIDGADGENRGTAGGDGAHGGNGRTEGGDGAVGALPTGQEEDEAEMREQ
jgi:arylsulfatase